MNLSSEIISTGFNKFGMGVLIPKEGRGRGGRDFEGNDGICRTSCESMNRSMKL